MNQKQLDQAVRLAGIAPDFINAHGKPQATSAAVKQKLLIAMGRDNPPLISPPVSPLPPVKVGREGKALGLTLSPVGDYRWTLHCETGEVHQGQLRGKKSLTLSAQLPLGYHQLTVEQGDQRWQCRIIITPSRCYEPTPLLKGEKLWGACVQLYTLRSANNWGIGDFGDLRQMIGQVGERQGAFIGLNPIHALYPAKPELASPYSPSSRRWLNIIYIDVASLEDFQQSKAAQQWWKKGETQQQLAKARASEWVDYTTVTRLKLTGLHLAFAHFQQRQASEAQPQAFQQFCHSGGESLYQHALFDALHAHLVQQDQSRAEWTQWPTEYQDWQSPQVQAFSQQYADEVTFYQWLQWVAADQFEQCCQQSQQQQMPIGLYRDLAVGVGSGGAETWCDAQLYCLQATVGAPPDILGPLGQNWMLPPIDPHIMASRGYQPFVDLLRANMKNCGALRIDHVMSLLRLWWIPRGDTAAQGAYVNYPVDDLLAVLALESQRHRCMVIGEDLGTVPLEIVDKLRDSGIYSYKVLYFEQDEENHFRAPAAYPQQAMATISTHDLPTLRGYWQSDDLTLGQRLGLYPDAQVLKQLYTFREHAKQGLLDALHQYKCVPKKVGHKASLLRMSPLLNRGLQRYVADSASALLGLQPEDWIDMSTPVNIPGTDREYPNWRRKLTQPLEVIFADLAVNRLLKDLTKRRRQAGKN